MISLNYKKYGTEGPILIILHGLYGMLDNWHTLATQFSQEFQVYLIDQRNHGKSPHTDEFNYEILSEDIYEFLLEHNLDNINLLGHSMGGKVAMFFAMEYPEYLNKLIIADIAPKAYKPHHQVINEALQGIDFSTINKRTDAENWLSSKGLQNSEIQFLLKNLVRGDNGYEWKMNLSSLTANNAEVNKEINPTKVFNKDTLFIKGSESKYIKLDDYERIMQQFPCAKIEVMEGSGHWLHADNPVLFKEIVSGFLRG